MAVGRKHLVETYWGMSQAKQLDYEGLNPCHWLGGGHVELGMVSKEEHRVTFTPMQSCPWKRQRGLLYQLKQKLHTHVLLQIKTFQTMNDK